MNLRLLFLKIFVQTFSSIDRILWFVEESFWVFMKSLGVVTISISLVLIFTFLRSNTPVLETADSIRNYVASELYFNEFSSNSGESVLGLSDYRKGPKLVNDVSLPFISAKSALAIDVHTGTVLYELNQNLQSPPASTTKLLTALVALDLYEMDDTLLMTEECSTLETQIAGMIPGKTYKVRDVMGALLVYSAGDSACLLATSVLSQDEFLVLMNKKAKSLEMFRSHFTNAVGFDDGDNFQVSTTSDLYKLAKAFMRDKTLHDLVGIREWTFNSIDSTDTPITVFNTNKLLWEIEGSVGVKTGTTYNAGEVLIYEYVKDNVDIMIIVMGSSDRFSDTKEILNWVKNSYKF